MKQQETRKRPGARAKTRIVVITALLSLPALTVGCSRPWEPAPLVAPLRLGTPAAEIGEELDTFVPGAMRGAAVPGLALAVVRDGEVILERGYGVRDSWTRSPVTPQTIFEVASNSKLVTAYSAMRLVGDGRLDLDTPLVSYLTAPFLPPTVLERGSGITLRHVLTHHSGLMNEPSATQEMLFDPGERFSYSGQGFQYAAAAIEAITGRPFSDHVEATVFAPLGMRSSGYGAEVRIVEAMASPHISVTMPWVVSSMVAAAVLVLLLVLRWIWLRLARDRERVLRYHWLFAVAALPGIAVFFVFLSTGNAIRFGVVSGLLFAALAATVLLWRRSGGHPLRTWRRVAAVAIMVPLGWAVIFRPPIPMEMRPPGSEAAGGLRSRAGDLALFLDELMSPTRLDQAMASEMLTPQVEVAERIAWGLGVGIQTGDSSDAIWHWGVNYPGYQSLVIGFPDERIGVVILMNGGPMSLTSAGTRMAGLELAREIAFRALGGEHYGYWNEVQ
jgi:CubicO group peptidase (beta-lactamase class C family)